MRSQPAMDQGARAVSGAACSDKARVRPTPPSRKVASYGPKLAVAAHTAVGVIVPAFAGALSVADAGAGAGAGAGVGAGAGAVGGRDDSAGQTAMLSHSAHNARPQIKRFRISGLGEPYDNADTPQYSFSHFFSTGLHAQRQHRGAVHGAAPLTVELSSSRV